MIRLTIFAAAFFSVIALLPFTAGAQQVGKAMDIFSVTDRGIDACAACDLVSRDEFWKAKLNTLLEGKGTVVSVEEKTQFRRKYRITLTSGSEAKLGLVYYIYTDKEDYMNLLAPGSQFGFKGQFVMFTPLNSKRNLYLLDIILEESELLHSFYDYCESMEEELFYEKDEAEKIVRGEVEKIRTNHK